MARPSLISAATALSNSSVRVTDARISETHDSAGVTDARATQAAGHERERLPDLRKPGHWISVPKPAQRLIKRTGLPNECASRGPFLARSEHSWPVEANRATASRASRMWHGACFGQE